MLMQMADEFYPMLSPGNRKAEVHSEPGITVFADPDKLARLFNNIFKNAIAYSYPNTTIRITARVEGKWVLVCFADVGRVIAPEKLNHIFEKFYRLDSSRSTQTGRAPDWVWRLPGKLSRRTAAVSPRPAMKAKRNLSSPCPPP